jgi:hypothetical protein
LKLHYYLQMKWRKKVMKLGMGSAKGPWLVEDEKKSKKIGAYTNWFQSHLWPPIAVTIKRHGNNSNALHFLKTTYKKPICQVLMKSWIEHVCGIGSLYMVY